MALTILGLVTVLVALVSEVFVESVQQAALSFGMTPAFVGFIVVSLVGRAGEMGDFSNQDPRAYPVTSNSGHDFPGCATRISVRGASYGNVFQETHPPA